MNEIYSPVSLNEWMSTMRVSLAACLWMCWGCVLWMGLAPALWCRLRQRLWGKGDLPVQRAGRGGIHKEQSFMWPTSSLPSPEEGCWVSQPLLFSFTIWASITLSLTTSVVFSLPLLLARLHTLVCPPRPLPLFSLLSRLSHFYLYISWNRQSSIWRSPF